jgi:hypothetical protein
MDAFYRDDAACLEESNKELFKQLQEINANNESTGNNVCILPGAGDRMHLLCMEKLGWQFK